MAESAKAKGKPRPLIREFEPADALWLWPMARAYGQELDLLTLLGRPNRRIWVVPHKACVAVFEDEHGTAVSGLTAEDGIKDAIRLAKEFAKTLPEQVHTHHHGDPDSWQYKCALRTFGFRPAEDDFLVREFKDGNWRLG